MYSMSFFKGLGCKSIDAVVDQRPLKQYLIHEFYPEDDFTPSSNITSEQTSCLKAIANRMKKTPLSQIKTKAEKNIMQMVIRVGSERKKIKKHMTPKTASEMGQSLERAPSYETGIASEVPSETLAEIEKKPRTKITKTMRHKPYSYNSTKIRRGKSDETGISSVPVGEPTVDDILEDPWVYYDWKATKGGATRRKKSRARKTRRYL